MASSIDPRAYVDSGAELGDNIKVAPFAVIESGAVIGDDCSIGPHAHIASWARLGREVQVHSGAVVGTDPQDLKFDGEETVLEVGARTVIREFVTLNRGTSYHMRTVIGSDCLFLAYSHVAHDCIVGDHVILDNSVQLAGHVEVGDWAIIGGLSGVQQFVHIGAHAFVGGMSSVRKDVPPFAKAAGDPLAFMGVNGIGLKRRGYSEERVQAISRAYRMLFQSGKTLKKAIEEVRNGDPGEDVGQILHFLDNRSRHGVISAPRRRRNTSAAGLPTEGERDA